MTRLTSEDLDSFRRGTHYRLYEKLGAHLASADGAQGAYFAVWAPRAAQVSVIGDFNAWDGLANSLSRIADSGIWEGFIPGVVKGALYKYHIVSESGTILDKADPFAFRAEPLPGTASMVWDTTFNWSDREWMASRPHAESTGEPMSIYEVHAGSWRRVPEEGARPLTYRELGTQLADYATEMGYTHIEFLPLTEHPFAGSWGYQTTGYFAPTSRFGSPQEMMEMIDRLHRHGIGVFLDWVPSHFAVDEHGLAGFDGSPLFERATPSDWNSHVFDYARNEVRSFLLSSALFWLDKYHVDGLRVDGVSTMLYRNGPGGERLEDPDGIAFLKQFNSAVAGNYPDALTIAEDSSAWPKVSHPVDEGGLGFRLKWDMGWMHDTLEYFTKDPIARKYHHDRLTFRIVYAFNENYVLPLSHDEVKPPFGSLLAKMPGDNWQKFANLRLLLSYMFAQPGKKLLFMGGEFAQWSEWNHEVSPDWHLTDLPFHSGVRNLAGTLNWLHKSEPALHERDFDPAGFEWIDCCDVERSIVSFLRRGQSAADTVAVVCNFTPVPRFNYRVGVPYGGWWKEIFNSDAIPYGGTGYGNLGGVEAAPVPWHGRRHSLNLTLPPLAAIFLRV